MKIKVVHTECGREALIQQVRDSNGHCPWDGKPYSKDYTANLAEALEAAEVAGSALERALDKIVGTSPELRLAEESILATVRGKIEEINAAAKAIAKAAAT